MNSEKCGRIAKELALDNHVVTFCLKREEVNRYQYTRHLLYGFNHLVFLCGCLHLCLHVGADLNVNKDLLVAWPTTFLLIIVQEDASVSEEKIKKFTCRQPCYKLNRLI